MGAMAVLKSRRTTSELVAHSNHTPDAVAVPILQTRQDLTKSINQMVYTHLQTTVEVEGGEGMIDWSTFLVKSGTNCKMREPTGSGCADVRCEVRGCSFPPPAVLSAREDRSPRGLLRSHLRARPPEDVAQVIIGVKEQQAQMVHQRL